VSGIVVVIFLVLLILVVVALASMVRVLQEYERAVIFRLWETCSGLPRDRGCS